MMSELKKFEPIHFRQLGVTILVVILMILSFSTLLARYISPQQFVFPQWVVLGAPCLIVLNLIVFIYGLFRRRLLAVLGGIALLACFHYISHVFQFGTRPSKEDSDIRLMTFNTRQFRMDYNVPSIANIEEFVRDNAINTLCLQEVPIEYSLTDLKHIFVSLPYVEMTKNRNGKSHLAILSKYPIVSSQSISFDERPNCALIADLLIKKHRLRMFNCHLQTTNWNQVKKNKTVYTSIIDHWMNAFSIISDNFKLRARQAAYLGNLVKISPYATLVCGDFNDAPLSYAYHTMKGQLKDAFREVGSGYSYTYRYFMKLFRIDFVLFSDLHVKALRYRTGDAIYSDHKPVIVDFKLNF